MTEIFYFSPSRILLGKSVVIESTPKSLKCLAVSMSLMVQQWKDNWFKRNLFINLGFRTSLLAWVPIPLARDNLSNLNTSFSFGVHFDIPFIFAIRGKSKSDIFKEFETRLKSDNIEQELDKSINQVKKIATLRLNEIIHE